jgi:uncharacterized protein (TIGR02231 family)
VSPDVPVHEVLLTEDRGLILRQGTLDWPGGAGVVTVSGVSPVLVDASLQVAADVGGIGRVAVRRSWAGEDTTALAIAARDRRESVATHKATLDRLRARRERTGGLLATLADAISAAASAGLGDAETWAAQLAEIHARLLARCESESDAADAVTEATASLAEIAAAMESASAKWRLSAQVEVALEAPAGPVVLSLRYLVPAALWRPAYRASLSNGAVTLTAQATLWQRTGEDWPEVPITLSTARPSTGATLPPLHTDFLGLRDKTAAERKTIQAHTWDQSIQKASLTGDEGLPGVDDGGEARTLQVARPLAIPSTGRPHRATIAEGTIPAKVRWRCIPEQAALVFREVTLDNPLPMPLLAGPVTLIIDGGTCGIGEIPFVAPGERFPLSFGSEDNVTVRYHREADIEERFALSDHRWLIQRVELTSTGSDALQIELVLRTPVSELKQVKIILDGEERTSTGMTGPDDQGFVRWMVDLPAGGSSSRKVAFRIERASNVQLPDFW